MKDVSVVRRLARRSLRRPRQVPDAHRDSRSGCRAPRSTRRRFIRRHRGSRARLAHVPRGRARPEGPLAAAADHQLRARSQRRAVTTTSCSQYDFAKGEKRADFTLEAVEKATPPETPCAYARLVPERHDDIAWENDRIAHRMYGLALNSRRRAASGCAAAASTCGASGLRTRSSIAGMRKVTTSSTRTTKAKDSISTASAARAVRAARASGTARNSGPATTS